MRPRLFAVAVLLLGGTTARAQEGFPLFTKDFPTEEFAQRRTRILDAIGPNAIALLQGAASPLAYVRFRQSNEFYYLSGIEIPHAYLLIDGATRRTTLYLPHRNESRELSEGKVLSAEDAALVRQLSGIENVQPSELMGEHVARMLRTASRTVYTMFSPAELTAMSRDLALRGNMDITSDPWDARLSREANFVQLVRTRFPQVELRDLTPTLDGLRAIKSEREVALIRKSSRIAGLALMESMRSTQPGVVESELDAVAKFIFHRNDAMEDAYYSLIGSSRNAWYPHYHENKRTMLDGDFVLMDYAPTVGYYTSDVTRMWPVNGRFSAGQRELYGFYLAAYKAIIKSMRVGITAQAAQREAAAEMERLFAEWTFSKPEYRAGAKQFVDDYKQGATRPNAAMGHSVGLAVHDDGAIGGVLRPGMVFSIEPALRVPEEKIYIRLEDMFVVTEKGVEWMTDFVPMDLDAIEKLMKEEGVLQKYPRMAITTAQD